MTEIIITFLHVPFIRLGKFVVPHSRVPVDDVVMKFRTILALHPQSSNSQKVVIVQHQSDSSWVK